MKNLFRLIPSLAFAAILVLRTSGKFVDTEFSQSDQVRAALYAFLSLDEVKLHKVNDAFDISQSAKFWGCDNLIKSNKRIMKPDELQKVVAALMLEVIVKMPPEHLDCLRQLQLDREEIFGHIKDQRLETVTVVCPSIPPKGYFLFVGGGSYIFWCSIFPSCDLYSRLAETWLAATTGKKLTAMI